VRRLLFATTAIVALYATPASAAPVAAAVSAVASFFAANTVAAALVRIGIGLVLSALARAQQPDFNQRTPNNGIRTDVTLTGGTNSDSFVLGRTATGGTFVGPPLTWRKGNRRMAYVIDIGCKPGHVIEAVYLNGDLTVYDGTNDKTQLPEPTSGPYRGQTWFRWYDGTQTTVDARLVDAFGDEPNFPWSSDMVGEGRTFGILEFWRDKEKPAFSGLPSALFQVQGIPLYDPRKDSTIGGSGSHRWGDDSTWEPTDNPVVMVYNILRGIALPGGDVWGGEAAEDDLPLDVWAAAANVCDEEVDLEGGGTEPRYRSGIEVLVADDEPADVIEKLLATCSGDVCEEGGSWYIHVGPPALPVYSFNDDDIIVTDAQDFEVYPSIASTVNGVAITYPEPASSWEEKDAPRLLNPDLEAKDDGRRLVDSLSLSACPYSTQVQRLGRAYVRDARRFRCIG